MPPGFDFPNKTAIWLASNTVWPENTHRSAHNYEAVGRLQSWVPLRQAQTEMEGIGARLERQYPESNRNKSVAITPMRDQMNESMWRSMTSPAAYTLGHEVR